MEEYKVNYKVDDGDEDFIAQYYYDASLLRKVK